MSKRLGIAVTVVAIAATLGLVAWRKHATNGARRSVDPAGSAHAKLAPERASQPAAVAPASTSVVVTGGGAPLSGATVRFGREGGDVVTATTGTDGVTPAVALEPGTWTVSATAPGFEPAAATAREMKAGETVKIELALLAGGRLLSGTITDATGGPIAGARIDAAKLGAMARPTDAVASALTGSDGTYKLSVAEGQLFVAASEPSYAPQARYVDVGPSGAVADFALVPGGVIEGFVRDERTHDVIAGAAVEATRDQPAMALGERTRQRVVTGADGRFRLAGLRPGGYGLIARSGALMSRAPAMIGLGVAEQVTDVELLVARAPSVRGIVVDEKGTPVPGVDIDVFGEGMHGHRGDARSDAKGAFVLEGVQPGRFLLMGHSGAYMPAGNVTVTVENADVTDVKVPVRAGFALHGHVEPRQVCNVSLESAADGPMDAMRDASDTTGADGAFDLGPVQAVQYALGARCPNGDQGTTKITGAANLGDVVIEVKPGASIAGRVVDGAGKPVAAVTVMASPNGETERTTIVNGMITSGIQGLTNGAGAFELRGLAAGSYHLSVLERGRPLPMKSGEPTVTVAAAEKKSGVTLTVDRPDGVIRGVVQGPDGKPLPEAWVSLHIGIDDLLAERMNHDGGSGSRMVRIETNDDDAASAGAIAPVLTDATGAFELRGLARIPMTVVAEADAGKLRGQAQKVVPDATITIQALGLTELRGTVKGPSGPPAWFTVELEGPSREQRSFATGDGTFSFARLDPGTYKVTVTSPSGNGEATVAITAGKPASVEISLAANAIVIGKLVDASGKPLGGLPVAVIPDTSTDGHMRVSLEGPPQTSNADGTFRIEAKAGKSGLIVLAPPRPTTRMGLALEAGKTLDLGPVTVDQTAKP